MSSYGLKLIVRKEVSWLAPCKTRRILLGEKIFYPPPPNPWKEWLAP